ncbi:MAG: copper chaperone PCu(A)C, partial [Hyphomicrobiaceae bacterium]
LKPGGTHLRFVGLKRPLRKDHSFNVRLNFEKAGPVDVLFMTTGIGGKSPYPDAAKDVSGSASGSRSRGKDN